jgi:hypothetical protein
MPQLDFSKDQKSQLAGWLNREKDYLLSVRSMATQILTPEITGTLELIKQDLEFVVRVRSAIRDTDNDEPIELSEQDSETLIDIGRGNKYANRAEFWRGIIEVACRD